MASELEMARHRISELEAQIRAWRRRKDCTQHLERIAHLDTEQSLEQWARDILELAIKERLVRLPRQGEWGTDPHPQARSSGELITVANKLRDMIVSHH